MLPSYRFGRFHRLLPVIVLLIAADAPPAPVQLTAEQDHQRLLDLLNIKSLRPGADPNHPDAPNAVIYDESKVKSYTLPDPLTLNNGKKVTTAKMWWTKRRPEIVEAFDSDVYGRVPKKTPAVHWEATGTTNETNGDVPVITKQLVGHVDNSSYPQITVDMQLSLTTPANAKGPVPVILEFGFDRPSCAASVNRWPRAGSNRRLLDPERSAVPV